MINFLNNLPIVHGATFTTTDGVILVTLWMGFNRAEKNPGHVNVFIHIDIN